MENQWDLTRTRLENELTQGRGYVRQLQVQLNNPSSSQEAREVLVNKITDSIARALSIVEGIDLSGTDRAPFNADDGLDPMSEDYDCDFSEQHRKNNSRKRKNLPRWTQTVRACTGKGLEGPLEDGYNWRKYGQKDILHANFPRGYYRCTLQKSHGCQATKQIQRTDDDPTIFQVTYRGNHTCSQNFTQQIRSQNSTQQILPPPPPPPPSSSSSSSSIHQELNNHKPLEVIWSFQSHTITSLNNRHDQLAAPAPDNYLIKCQPSTSNFSFQAASSSNAVLSSHTHDKRSPSPLPDNTNYLLRSLRTLSWPPDQMIMGHELNQLDLHSQGDDIYAASSMSPAVAAATDNTQDLVPDFPYGRSEEFEAGAWPFGDEGFYS